MNTGISMVVILVITLLSFVIMVYRKIDRMVSLIKENRRYIYVLLDTRTQLTTALRDVVVEQTKIKDSFLNEVAQLNQQAQEAKKQRQLKDYMRIENRISLQIPNLDLLFAEHPKLQANNDAMELKENMMSVQHDIELTQQAYNLALEAYNKTKNAFFDSMMITVFPQELKINFPYWKMETKK